MPEQPLWAEIDYTPRERAALGGEPGICRSLSPDRQFMCDRDAGHDGDCEGFELPTITLDEPVFPPAGGAS